MEPIAPQDRRPHDAGKHSNFKASAFTRAAPRDSVHFLESLLDTQAFNEFILERCSKPPDDPEIVLFDQIIIAKRNRGRHGLFQKQLTPLVSKPATVNLQVRKAVQPNETKLPAQWQPPQVPPPKLDALLLLPPRLAQPRTKFSKERGIRRKPVSKSDETIQIEATTGQGNRKSGMI